MARQHGSVEPRGSSGSKRIDLASANGHWSINVCGQHLGHGLTQMEDGVKILSVTEMTELTL